MFWSSDCRASGIDWRLGGGEENIIYVLQITLIFPGQPQLEAFGIDPADDILQ
jgi:hypothetical protein